MNKTKRIVLIGILVSQALVLHIIERLIPVPIPVPGVKLGLANAVSLFAIAALGWRDAIVIVVLRTILSSLFGGGISSFLYSLAGGLLSIIIMAFLYNKFRDLFSIPAISAVGAIFHNIGQLIAASLVISNVRIFYYLPVLMISGIITGLFIGIAVQYIIEPLRLILKLRD